MISFNVPTFLGAEEVYLQDVFANRKLSGDGKYTKLCQTLLEEHFHSLKALLTTSCTHALEMAAVLSNIQPGDEVVAPSYTFVSTVNAFVLRGAKIVFVDIRPDTMNINEMLIEDAITSKTKAIIPVHYAGVACEMDIIMEIAKRHNLIVVEDAAQAVMSKYKGKALGTIGNYGCFSFHETKNYTMGEGGAILIRDKDDISRAEIVWEKGTNRKQFFRGQVDKYTWVDIGSSYLPNELSAAYLYAQLEVAEEINRNRINTWQKYHSSLIDLKNRGFVSLAHIPATCEFNAHMFYIKCKNLEERTLLIEYLKKRDVFSVFHYVPLHSSPAGLAFSRFHGEDQYTTRESERLVRLPLYYNMAEDDVERVVESIKSFYN